MNDWTGLAILALACFAGWLAAKAIVAAVDFCIWSRRKR